MHERINGRMRIRPDQAQLLYFLLGEERFRVLSERSNWKGLGVDLRSFQQAIALIDSMTDELRRTADEQGWELGKSERPDTERAGTSTAS